MKPHKTVQVTVLLAARNEETNIIRCLENIEVAMKHTALSVEVLIGNDASTDQTGELVSHWIDNKPHFQLIHIQNNLLHLKAKANVLAQLAQQARGECFFITDADISVPPSWFDTLWQSYQNGQHIVTGLTLIKNESLNTSWQNIEWLLSLYVIYTLSERGIPVTAMGNNMLVSKKAYEAVGGYEGIPFSITEDFELFKQVVEKGFGFKNLYQKEILAWSEPCIGFHALLRQRKRWMHGAMKSSWLLKIPLLINSFQWLLWPVFFMLWPVPSLVAFGLKYSFQLLLLLRLHALLDLRPRFIAILTYEFYVTFVYALLMPYYFWPKPTLWKERRL